MLAALRGRGITPLRKKGGGDVPAESGEAAFQLDAKDGGVQDRPRPKSLLMKVSVILRTGRKAGSHRGVAPTGEVSEAIWRWVTQSK